MLDYKSFHPIADVLEAALPIYGLNNWRKGGEKTSKLSILESLQRHVGELIDAVNEGKDEVDHQTGQHLIGHIGANMMFYSYHHVVNNKVK